MNSPSAYVAGLKDMAMQANIRHSKINEIVSNCKALSQDELPPLPFVNIIGSDTYEHFKVAMCGTFSELMRRFKLTSESSVLDIGSGCGRLAFPFSMLLESGCYYGVDVWKEGVDWCNDRFSASKENLSFSAVESKNNYYFDEWDEGLFNDYRIPFVPNESIDLAFAISCFSHLVEMDCRSYFHELRRTLKFGGCAYITGFVIDRYFYDYVEKTGQHRAVREKSPGCFYAYSGQDFFGGFTLRKWTEMLSDAGLEIVVRDTGSWAEKPGSSSYQDVFIVTKR